MALWDLRRAILPGTGDSSVTLPLLSAHGVTKRYQGNIALENFDLDIQSNEILALIGPNGAGKTTCFNVLNGQVRPDSGQVLLAGQNIVGWRPWRLYHFGMARTFQIASVFSSMTVRENLQIAYMSWRRRSFQFYGSGSEAYRKDALNLLDSVALLHRADIACEALSYGELKIVEFALALVGEPRLLLMDEPTAGLAPGARRGIMDLVVRIARARNMAILFTEHDMDMVFGYADRIHVIAGGKTLKIGKPHEVRSDPIVQEIYLGSASNLG